MEVKTIEVYTLWHEEQQCELTMTLGRIVEINNNTAWRWKLQGKHIPFPVRSNTWFEGFQPGVMIQYMRNCGYEVDAIVNMCTGKAHLFNRRTTHEPNAEFRRYICMLVRRHDCAPMAACIVAHAFDISLYEANHLVTKWLTTAAGL